MSVIVQAKQAVDWMAVFSAIAGVIYSTYIHHYVVRLERIGCDCAMDFRRTYIQWYTLALVIIGLLNIFAHITGGMNGFLILNAILAPFMLVGFIVYIIFVIQYINRLKTEKCRCSEGMARSLLYIVTLINVALISMAALFMLFATLAALSYRDGKK